MELLVSVKASLARACPVPCPVGEELSPGTVCVSRCKIPD